MNNRVCRHKWHLKYNHIHESHECCGGPKLFDDRTLATCDKMEACDKCGAIRFTANENKPAWQIPPEGSKINFKKIISTIVKNIKSRGFARF